MKPKSINFLIELVITISLWVLWFRSAEGVLKDALDGDIYQYLNTNIWKVGCVLGLMLSMILVGYAIYRHSHQASKMDAFIALEPNTEEMTSNREIQSVSQFFDLEETEVQQAKASKKITVDFPISTLKCKLSLNQNQKS